MLNWFDALDSFEDSAFIKDYFSADFVKISFAAIERDKAVDLGAGVAP